jgi:hypothetical protein
MAAPAVSLLDAQADLWRVDEEEGESEMERARRLPPTHSPERAEQQAAPSPALAIVPRRSLRDRLQGIDLIIETVEALDNDGELTPELRDELSAQLIGELAGTRAKVDATASALAMFESLELSAAREVKRLEARKSFYARQRERLETYILATLEASQLNQLQGDTNTLARRANPPRVEVDDVHALPREFQRYAAPPPPPPPTADKAALAKALRAKRDVPGARLVPSFRLVRS